MPELEFPVETLVSSGRLFRRKWTVTVDNLDVSNLDIEFKILTSIKPEPNKCVLTVWNMNEGHRMQMLKRNKPLPGSAIKGVQVTVEAGYVGQTSVLFSGDSSEIGSKKVGPDWQTIISAEDGGRAYREARISMQLTKGTSIATVVQQCAKAMAVGTGNVSNFEASAEIAGYGKTLPHNMTLDGSAASQLKKVFDSIGLVWSIQNGALQVSRKGSPLDLSAILLSPETGLVGSPENSIDASVSLGSPQQFAKGAKPKTAKVPKSKDPTIIKLKSLLIPGLVPARKIELRSQSFNGAYFVTEVERVGQSYGNDWHNNMIARVY